MTKPVNTEAFAKSTGKSWAEWAAFLASIGAREMTHKEIAARIVETGEASGWWAQGITVAWEQHIGRRQPGQRSDGTFEVAVNRTMAGAPDDVLALWAEAAPGMDVPFEGEPSTSGTGKRLYWRSALADGTRLIVAAETRQGKTNLTVTHEKLPDAEAKEHWRGVWKEKVARL